MRRRRSCRSPHDGCFAQDETSLAQVANYRSLLLVVLLLKNQHHTPNMPELAEVACRFLAFLLTKRVLFPTLLRTLLQLLTAFSLARPTQGVSCGAWTFFV